MNTWTELLWIASAVIWGTVGAVSILSGDIHDGYAELGLALLMVIANRLYRIATLLEKRE